MVRITLTRSAHILGQVLARESAAGGDQIRGQSGEDDSPAIVTGTQKVTGASVKPEKAGCATPMTV